MGRSQPQRSLAQRLLWFAALWCLGVASVAIVALILRLWLMHR